MELYHNNTLEFAQFQILSRTIQDPQPLHFHYLGPSFTQLALFKILRRTICTIEYLLSALFTMDLIH